MRTVGRIGSDTGVPGPVRRYLRRALPEASEIPLRAKLDYSGRLCAGTATLWKDFHTVEEIHQIDVAFDASTHVRRAPMLWTDIHESYDGHTSLVTSRLWGRLPARRLSDTPSAVSQPAHYLSMLPWMPYASLANPFLHWTIDSRGTIHISLGTGHDAVTATVTLTPAGDIATLRMLSRPRQIGGRSVSRWRATFTNYGQISGLWLPGRSDTYWDTVTGAFHFRRIIMHSLSLGL